MTEQEEIEGIEYCPNCCEGIMVNYMCIDCGYPGVLGRMDF